MYTIQDLRDGKCDVINDGSVEELNQVIRAACPEDNTYWNGTAGYYHIFKGEGACPRYKEIIPTQSVHEFLKQL